MPEIPPWDARKFVAALSAQDRLALLAALQSPASDYGPGLSDADLLKAEAWLRDRAASAAPGHARARWRMWFIFMFLRYGALKLSEALRLRPQDLEFDQCQLAVHGIRPRRVFLPPQICRNLRSVWCDWAGGMAGCAPFACDASQARRLFCEGAKACGLPPGSLNASSLRRHRFHELVRQGAPPAVATFFQDNARPPAPFTPEQAQLLLRQLICMPQPRTSARNIFRGQIISLRPHGILVDVTLQTAQNLIVKAVITATSRQCLSLAEGQIVSALVKAPWLELHDASASVSAGNCFPGIVEQCRQDDQACEVLVTIAAGCQLCALLPAQAASTINLEPGAAVKAAFSPLAVILTTA